MPRFIIEELMSADFLKNLANHPRDRAQELQPMLRNVTSWSVKTS